MVGVALCPWPLVGARGTLALPVLGGPVQVGWSDMSGGAHPLVGDAAAAKVHWQELVTWNCLGALRVSGAAQAGVSLYLRLVRPPVLLPAPIMVQPEARHWHSPLCCCLRPSWLSLRLVIGTPGGLMMVAGVGRAAFGSGHSFRDFKLLVGGPVWGLWALPHKQPTPGVTVIGLPGRRGPGRLRGC